MATGIGVTIGSSTVRAVEVRKKGVMWQVTNALVHPLTASDDAGRVAEARAVLQQSGMKGTSLVGLSGRDLIVRYTKAPRVPDWRLEMLMGFEIAEVAEQSGGDVAADWALLSLPAAAGEDDTVLVALSRNAHLKPRLDALSSAGIGTLGACPRSLALYNAFIANCDVPPGEVTMIVHLGGENTDVAIQRDGALLFARNLAGGGKPFTDALQETFNVPAATAEKMKQQKGNVTPRQRARYADSSEEKVANTLLGTAGTVVSAVHSSLMFCKAQTKLTDLRVDRVLVSGAGSRLRGMCEYLASSLGVPVEPFEPFETVDTSSLPPDAASSISESGVAMAAALGLAQMAAEKDAFRLEILPEAERKKRHFVQHTAWLIASGVVAAAGLVFLYTSAAGEEAKAASDEKKVKSALEHASSQREEGENRRRQVEKAVDRLAVLKSEVALGPNFERALDVLQKVIDSNPEFQAVHFPSIRARIQQMEVPEEFTYKALAAAAAESAGEDPPEEDSGGGGDDGMDDDAPDGPEESRVPLVTINGAIQARRVTPSKVFSAFTSALKAAVGSDLPHAEFKLQTALTKQNKFEVKIVFFDGYRPVGR